MNPRYFVLFLIVVAVALLAGCSRAPVLTLANRSTLTISNVVVSGSGFSNRIDSVASGRECSLTIHPQGKSGVHVAFDAAGQHIDSGEQGYFEDSGSYRVRAVVSANLTVSVTSDIRPY